MRWMRPDPWTRFWKRRIKFTALSPSFFCTSALTVMWKNTSTQALKPQGLEESGHFGQRHGHLGAVLHGPDDHRAVERFALAHDDEVGDALRLRLRELEPQAAGVEGLEDGDFGLPEHVDDAQAFELGADAQLREVDARLPVCRDQLEVRAGRAFFAEEDGGAHARGILAARFLLEEFVEAAAVGAEDR